MTDSPASSDSSSFVPLQAVIFDWAGTVCDFGSLAPVLALHKLFAAQGVPITSAQARGPMGRAKRDHIADILGLADVATRWQQVHGSRPGEAEIDRLFAQFLPMQLAELRERAQLIPACCRCWPSCVGVGSRWVRRPATPPR
jgi:phosphonoacetaldehyde hydrolase